MSRAAIAVFVLTAPFLSAQDPESDLPEVRFELDADGCVTAAPHPLVGEDAAVIASDLDGSFSNLGLLGFATLLFGGPSDLASLSDAPRFFDRLGEDEDAELFQRIGRAGEDGDPAYVALVRLLAVRAAERRGVKAALPLVERVAAEEGADPFLRAAAGEAAVVLRGQPRPVADLALAELDEVLAEVPAGAGFVIRIDRYRLPGAPSLPHWARLIAMEVTRQRGPGASEEQLAGAAMLSEIPGLLPYELARRFGNHRIDRVVAALRIPQGGMIGSQSFWMSLEGLFDLDRIRGGLEGAQVPHAVEEGEVRLVLGGGYTVAIAARRVLFTTEEFAGELDRAGADALREALGGDAAVALQVGEEVPVPDAVARVKPNWIQAHVPASGEGVLRLVGRWADPTGAAALRGMIRSAPGLLERLAGDVAAVEPVLDALDEMTDELDGENLTVEVPIPDVEIGEVVHELVRAGVMR